MYSQYMKAARVEEIYNDLEQLVIALDPDPSARGPAYLQDLISKTRGYLNQVSYYMQEVHRQKHQMELELEALEAAFEVSSDELLASDTRVTRLPSIDDRKAMINIILSDERKEIQKVKRSIKNLSHVEKAVRHRHKELESTMAAIRLQRSLLASEIRTGSFYGDETDTSRGTWGRKSPMGTIDSSELDALFDSAQDVVPATAPEESDVVAPEAPPIDDAKTGAQDPEEDPSIGVFLDGADYSDEFADIFNDI